jgi:hypothetical protein
MTRHWTPSAKSGRPLEIVSWIEATRPISFGFPCLCFVFEVLVHQKGKDSAWQDIKQLADDYFGGERQCHQKSKTNNRGI